MGLRLEALGAVTVFTCTSVSLFLLPSLSAGLVGLLVTTSLSLTGDLHWLVRQRTELEVQLNAVERIIEYANIRPEESDERWNVGVRTELLDEQQRKAKAARVGSRPTTPMLSQSPTTSPSAAVDLNPRSSAMLIPPPSWPEHGRIEFHSLTAAYRPPPNDVAVLHDLSAVINAGEKVGIVGRTGAGQPHSTQTPRNQPSSHPHTALYHSRADPLSACVYFLICAAQASRPCRCACFV